ncbi:hypothetical protein EVAR_4959_1 [Eumeta japonica]|uniref:Uncharacterized protein n=1 Tax=Eumeta variegata TaxID=151549 RepID=A0A4C1UZ02_EUMVA|nr:hypothetical protein EVAR_4959_1 [Eumeta japonica]
MAAGVDSSAPALHEQPQPYRGGVCEGRAFIKRSRAIGSRRENCLRPLRAGKYFCCGATPPNLMFGLKDFT